MRNKKDLWITVMNVLSVSLLSAMLTVVCLSAHDADRQFQLLGNFCQLLVEENVADADQMMEQLKEAGTQREGYQNHILIQYGYSDSDFIKDGWGQGYFPAAVCFAAGALVFLSSFFYWHKKECRRMQRLTGYLEKARTGRAQVLSELEEGAYARLQDEMVKTVTELYQTRDAALIAKRNFADHLYQIAHQLKTPITAISLSAQMMQEVCTGGAQREGNKTEMAEAGINRSEHSAQSMDISAYVRQIQKQTARLAYLEEALLLLSRVDAGTLVLNKKKTDVFTLLNLAADSLQELFAKAEVTADIPDMGEAEIFADMEWTMEAVINLLKNCMEHSPAGAAVHCSYEQNPIYVQIRIWDEGEGFAKEDMPHLFERFYRGKRAGKGGIGIGLPFAKEIFEMQNGMIRAGNLPAQEGGAYFEIRMYCH